MLFYVIILRYAVKKEHMGFLNDSEQRKKAAMAAQEKSQLRQKRLALVETRRQRSDDVKIDTIRTFLALGGNLSLTSGAVGIPYETLKKWKASNWWKQVITEIRKEDRLHLNAKTSKILHESLSQLGERLENGDHFFNVKTGKFIRKPLSARDLHKITVDMMERKDKLELALEEKQVISSDEDKLKNLAEQFASLALKAAQKQVSQNTGEVVDISFKET